MNDVVFVPTIRMGARVLILPQCSFGGGSEMLHDGDLADRWALNEGGMK